MVRNVNSSKLATEKDLNEGLGAVRKDLNEGLGAVRKEFKRDLDMGLNSVREEFKEDLEGAVDAILGGMDTIAKQLSGEIKENRTRIENVETEVKFTREDMKDFKVDLSMTVSKKEFESFKRKVLLS